MRGLMLLECSATEIMAGDIRFRSFGDRPRLQSNPENEQLMDPDEAESQAHIMSIALFEQFYSRWVKEEESLVASLRKALENPNRERELSRLVKAGFESYSQVVEAKIQMAQEDATYIAAGAWKTPLEAGLMWMGGWRPSTAIVFAFSLMGMQIQMDFKKILEGIEVPSMAALSPKQLSRLDALQQSSHIAEDDISGRMAVFQMLLADQQMAQVMTAEPPPSDTLNDLSELKGAMESKLAGLRDLLIEAEKIRLQTLQEMYQVLTPVQAAQYTVATFEMEIALRKLGEETRESHAPGDMHPSSSGRGPINLMEVTLRGDVAQLEEALMTGVDPSETDYNGQTALHLAASKGLTDCVALLVKEGADVNKKDNLGMTPLWKALRGGHDAAAQILVNNGAKPLLKEAGTEMCKAAASRDMEYVERLVKAGVDPNVVDYSQRTPLHVVAAQGTAEAVKFLVQEGADVFARDRHGYTPVDEARENDNEQSLKILQDEVVRWQQQQQQDDDDDNDTTDYNDSSSSAPMEGLQDAKQDTLMDDSDKRSSC
ncbi:hypothetical protein BDL97_17G082300 [Sphagnum fallax]|nr:hypothetical protein BDL97_17G082300 [Sphagnum fallax]